MLLIALWISTSIYISYHEGIRLFNMRRRLQIISPESNPEMFQKTAMVDTKSASLKQTEIENSFTKMKAILEALRKEVSQINAGRTRHTWWPDPNLTRCDTSSQQRTRNASSQTAFSPEWSQGIQELQKRSVKLRRDRYKFGRNKIIRERERNLSYCWNAFHSKTSKWSHITILFWSRQICGSKI